MRHARSAFARSLSTLVLLGLAAACGDSEGRLQVTGTVKHPDGSIPQGLGPAYVRFEPEDRSNQNARSAAGTIDRETGEFSLFTVKPGDGALPGKYKVIFMIDTSYPPKPGGASSVVPVEYLSAETTPLSAEISSSQRHFDFEVPKREPGKKK
jgi:hypothetical protein